MTFNSIDFAILLVVVLALYWTVPKRVQNPLLLGASYIFYGAWDWRFAFLMLASTVNDYVVARLLDRTDDERRRKLLLGIALSINLGILGFFKYFNFFVDSGYMLLDAIGLSPNPPTLEILLPVGISFYTFQTMSYGIDVYRRRIPAERNFLHFALFVAFFPHLVAGPIMRAESLLSQLRRPRDRSNMTSHDVRSGLFLILMGLFKKVAIADGVAHVANEAAASADSASFVALLLGMYAFAMRFYGDFAGYSDIARGTARLLGIELMRNFEQPLLMRNVSEFWRRWHISLSSWMHDYLYIPLGGNRHGRVRTLANLMLTMFIVGLWHGAEWNFVLWGLYNGICLAVHRGFTRPYSQDRPYRPHHVLYNIVTFHVVILGLVLLQAGSLTGAIHYWAGLAAFRGGALDIDAILLTAGACATLVGIDIAQRIADTDAMVMKWRPAFRGIAYATMLLGIVVFSGGAPEPFIYFQF